MNIQAVPTDALPIIMAMVAIHHSRFVLNLPVNTLLPSFLNFIVMPTLARLVKTGSCRAFAVAYIIAEIFVKKRVLARMVVEHKNNPFSNWI